MIPAVVVAWALAAGAAHADVLGPTQASAVSVATPTPLLPPLLSSPILPSPRDDQFVLLPGQVNPLTVPVIAMTTERATHLAVLADDGEAARAGKFAVPASSEWINTASHIVLALIGAYVAYEQAHRK